ncbi:hypothetical protein CEXT_257801 [Caerostris extrusa]|uniref:Uncharacterized protein n=1 Tax=Caerostris extrusa TaxID=172846 RepID=A0AAV4XLT0_CAEEX|nr:hypothetical protein CEXT_257801 [Caerostris extrusa]
MHALKEHNRRAQRPEQNKQEVNRKPKSDLHQKPLLSSADRSPGEEIGFCLKEASGKHVISFRHVPLRKHASLLSSQDLNQQKKSIF